MESREQVGEGKLDSPRHTESNCRYNRYDFWGWEIDMRDKLIDRIYRLSEEVGLDIFEDLKQKSNDELLSIFAELVLESYLSDKE